MNKLLISLLIFILIIFFIVFYKKSENFDGRSHGQVLQDVLRDNNGMDTSSDSHFFAIKREDNNKYLIVAWESGRPTLVFVEEDKYIEQVSKISKVHGGDSFKGFWSVKNNSNDYPKILNFSLFNTNTDKISSTIGPNATSNDRNKIMYYSVPGQPAKTLVDFGLCLWGHNKKTTHLSMVWGSDLKNNRGTYFDTKFMWQLG